MTLGNCKKGASWLHRQHFGQEQSLAWVSNVWHTPGMKITARPPQTLLQRRPPKPDGPRESVDQAFSHPADAFQARAHRCIDKAFDALGLGLSTLGSGIAGGLAGALAGSLLGPTGTVVGLAGGALAGGAAGGAAYASGHGDTLGRTAMGLAALATGALVGSLAGPTGTLAGAGLGALYAGAGLYFSRD